jgi:xanthine dehydrogenase accessory factor
MRVFIEPIFPNPILWLLGRGALVDYLCALASDLEFDVIVDDVEANMVKHPSALRVITDDHRYEKLMPQKGDYVVIATHHKGDYLALHQALRSEADYIGVVTSRKRSALVMDRLRADGITDE